MKRIATAVVLAGLAFSLAPQATADPSDPSTWPEADAAGYKTADDPGWVFFRAPGQPGTGCGISPSGTVGCDIVVQWNDDGTPMQVGTPGPPGFYSCNPPGGNTSCPLPPSGANQIVADPQQPARYVKSDTASFTRNVGVLPAGYRLVNGNAWCYVSAASPGGINCRTGGNGFLWSSWGGILESS